MNLDITLNKILFFILLYPVILFFPNILGEEGFWLTAPYFFSVFLFLFAFFIYSKQLKIPIRGTLFVLFVLFLVTVINFSSIRYSLPIFFGLYGIVLFIVLSSIKYNILHFKLVDYFLYLYFILSLPFLLSSIGYVHQGRFAGFVGSPTIYSGFITVMFVVISLKLKLSSIKYIIFYIITLILVYMTKTRLLLVFIIIYPILRELLKTKLWLTNKNVFILFYGITIFIYPLYNILVEWFPNLVTSRYEGKTDTSFGLRNYLFLESKKYFLEGNLVEIIFGRGNEYARKFIHQLMSIDYMPHNDYLRILIDWGIFGFLIFSLLLYKLAIKNVYTLFISLTYMILFYSNMIFNLFLLSILMLFYFKKE